jgi:hypothetical protein
VHHAAYLTLLAVPANNGWNRQDLSQSAHDAMLACFDKHKPASAEMRGTIVAN